MKELHEIYAEMAPQLALSAIERVFKPEASRVAVERKSRERLVAILRAALADAESGRLASVLVVGTGVSSDSAEFAVAYEACVDEVEGDLKKAVHTAFYELSLDDMARWDGDAVEAPHASWDWRSWERPFDTASDL